jgi:hypothetical protein
MVVKQNIPAEIRLISQCNLSKPAGDIRLRVVFTAPDSTEKTVPAFYDGGDVWKVRYSSPVIGHHTYKTVSDEPSLDSACGELDIIEYDGENPLYSHGSICRRNDDLHLSYSDGTPFFWLGDTWWMGLTKRLDMEGLR